MRLPALVAAASPGEALQGVALVLLHIQGERAIITGAGFCHRLAPNLQDGRISAWPARPASGACRTWRDWWDCTCEGI